MNFFRNTFGVLLGLFVAMCIIILGITLNEDWIKYDNYNPNFPFKRWQRVVKDASDWFFVALLISGGVASIIGGIITAFIVKHAKIAYSILLGFILYLIGLGDSWINYGHPTWYNVLIIFILFPFSWLGGRIVSKLTAKKILKDIPTE